VQARISTGIEFHTAGAASCVEVGGSTSPDVSVGRPFTRPHSCASAVYMISDSLKVTRYHTALTLFITPNCVSPPLFPYTTHIVGEYLGIYL